MDDEESEGRGLAQFSLQRHPEEIFGKDDSCAKLYPVTELDPVKVLEACVKDNQKLDSYLRTVLA